MRSKAAVLYRMGPPPPYARSKPLVVEDIEIDGPHEGEVLVELAAAGLCHSDLSVIDGSRPRVMPMVLGHEAAGIVREVGRGVQSVAEGDHVVFSFVPVCGRCAMCAMGRAAMCENGAKANLAGTLLNGARRFRNSAGQELNHHLGVSAFSQFTIAMPESLVKVDRTLPLDKAALFGLRRHDRRRRRREHGEGRTRRFGGCLWTWRSRAERRVGRAGGWSDADCGR